MKKIIDEKIPIEELVEILPASVTYLSKMGVKCISNYFAFLSNIEKAAKEKGFGDQEITGFVMELNALQKSNQE